MSTTSRLEGSHGAARDEQAWAEALARPAVETRGGDNVTTAAATSPADAVAARVGLDAAALLRVALAATLDGPQQQGTTPTAERVRELLSYDILDWATSAPWDNRPGGVFVDSPGWGRFVGKAYGDVQASRVFR